MHQHIAALWVEALRSGKYKQTPWDMRKDGPPPSFSCLGVLCDLHREASPEDGGEWKIHPDTKVNFYLGRTDFLPKAVMDWAGMSSALGLLPRGHPGRGSLAKVNGEGATFLEIADIIEKEQNSL